MAQRVATSVTPALDAALVKGLRQELRGPLLEPADPGYREARSIWNGMIEKQPALIARASGAADVVACVNFARAHRVPLSVRGGGHNIAGAALSDGGLTIDMSLRRSIRVDLERRTVRADAGVTWGDMDHETLGHGLVVPGGIVSATGIAGFTLGGGFGWTSRAFGLAADNLVAADVVTADGVSRRVSRREHADLFWAMCGGSGNFAVVTSFEYQAHEHGPLALCGMVVYPMSEAERVINAFAHITSTAPDELCLLLILRIAPPIDALPKELHGKPIAAIAACWVGRPELGAEAMAPVKSFGRPLLDDVATKPFVALQTMLDSGQPFGRRYYWKSDSFASVSDGLIAGLAESARRITSPFSAILCMHLGGVSARMSPDTNAVGFRTAEYLANIQGAWENAAEDDVHIGWARDAYHACHGFALAQAYVNFMTQEEGEERVRAAYGDDVYARLRAVKAKYDPSALFHGVRTILPA